MSITETLVRAMHLAGLVIAPGSLSPEPIGPASAGGAVLAVVVLLAPVAITVWLWRTYRTFASSGAAIASSATVVALLALGTAYSGSSAPLLRAYGLAAPFVWIALAFLAATLAGIFLDARFKNRSALAGVLVLMGGVVVYQLNRDVIGSRDGMWRRVLERDPGNATAIAALVADPDKGDPAGMRAALDACIARDPRSCTCLGKRAAVRLRLADLARATSDAKAAIDASCALDAGSPRLRESAALAFAESGDTARATAALDGASDRESNPKLVYADALVHAQSGDAAGAEALAKKAVDLGAGRDAKLLLAQLLIGRGANDDARAVLKELVSAKPPDAKALYDLALVEDRAGHYNEAREGYLAALRADPTLKDARYNLAYLTLHQGIVGEARHHAQAFVASFPDDPRGPELLKLTGAAAKEDSH